MTELRESCESVLEGGLMMIEGVEDLTVNHEGPEVEEEIAETVSVMLGNTEDPMRERRIIALVSTIGQKLGSERLVALSKDLMEQWNQ